MPLQKNQNTYFQPVKIERRDNQELYNNLGPYYQPDPYYSKTLNRTREKHSQKLNRLKKSESLREKLSCVGAYDTYDKPNYPEQDYSENEKRNYLQLLKSNYISNSSRNIAEPFCTNYNTVGPYSRDEKPSSKHKKIVYADLALGNHNMKFKNTVNSKRHMYEPSNSDNSMPGRKGSQSQPRSDYATLKFNEIDV